jgi:glyoxylase-like metal-dependent hydrolase (beta-lactamase superfamily II)
MVTRLRLAVILGLAFVGAYAYAQQQQQPSKLNTIKVKDGLYVIHNDFVPGNTTALVTSEGVVLVDDKFEVDHDNIIAELKKVTTQPVKYVINTHHHFDHSGGNAKMQAMGGVQIIAAEAAWQNMVDGNLPGKPSVTFNREAHLHLGGKNVDIYHFGRSHTNGDSVVLFPAERVLSAGDMFTYGDATPQLIDYAGGGSAKEWTTTLDSVLALDFDGVVPGHGDVTTKAEMRKFRDSTVRLRTRVHDKMTQRKSRDDIAKMLQSEFHFADLHLMFSLDGLMAEVR